MAVTITPAVLLTRMAVGETDTPICCSRLPKLCAEKSVCLAVACAIQADNQSISDQLVLSHPFDAHEFFQPRCALGKLQGK